MSRTPQVQLELLETRPPRSVPRQRCRNSGDDDSSRPTASDRNAHSSLRSSASRTNIPSVIAIPFAAVVDTLSVTGNRDDSPNPRSRRPRTKTSHTREHV